MKKTLKNLAPGDIFTFAGERFVVLEHLEGGTFVLTEGSIGNSPFQEKDTDTSNDYSKSAVKDMVDKFVAELPRNSAEAAAILPFEVDLSCTDRSASYGTITVKAAPLTLWQYGQFEELIPPNEDEWWWLVTPRACRELRSPYTGDTNLVWLAHTNGGYNDYYASCFYGVRPALKLDFELLVSVEGDENEGEDCECDSPRVDLGKVDTLTLVREVERRLSYGVAYGADSQDTEGESE